MLQFINVLTKLPQLQRDYTEYAHVAIFWIQIFLSNSLIKSGKMDSIDPQTLSLFQFFQKVQTISPLNSTNFTMPIAQQNGFSLNAI